MFEFFHVYALFGTELTYRHVRDIYAQSKTVEMIDGT